MNVGPLALPRREALDAPKLLRRVQEDEMRTVSYPRDSFMAIDPGPVFSAWVIFSPTKNLQTFAIEPNEKVRERLLSFSGRLVLEMVASYGMPVGKDVFETVYWIGRFAETHPDNHCRMYRKDVVLHICHTPRGNDATVRQAVIDRYPSTGGGKLPQVGTKAKPGPLYGVSNDVWQALALAIAYAEIKLVT